MVKFCSHVWWCCSEETFSVWPMDKECNFGIHDVDPSHKHVRESRVSYMQNLAKEGNRWIQPQFQKGQKELILRGQWTKYSCKHENTAQLSPVMVLHFESSPSTDLTLRRCLDKFS